MSEWLRISGGHTVYMGGYKGTILWVQGVAETRETRKRAKLEGC